MKSIPTGYLTGYKSIICVARFFSAVFFTALLLSAGLGCDNKSEKADAPKFVATQVYCGRNIPAGGEVSEEQFAEFMETVVTPAFPAGLTAYDAYGQMQTSEGKIVRQKTKVLLLVHDNSQASLDSIHKIAGAYRNKFGNPQVMIITSPVTPEFYGN